MFRLMQTVIAPENDGLIDRYCRDNGLNLQQFKDLVGISRTALFRVRTGDSEVSTDIFDRIEIATGISAVDLFAEWHGKRSAAVADLERRLQPT
jgi:hypothetical protein